MHSLRNANNMFNARPRVRYKFSYNYYYYLEIICLLMYAYKLHLQVKKFTLFFLQISACQV